MPEWTCGRCTFINHELMNNCEMCEAPREAAEIPYLGDRSGGNDIPMDHQTTQEPSADAMLDERREMEITRDSEIQSGQSTQPDTSSVPSFNEAVYETNSSIMDTAPQQQGLLTEMENGIQERPRLPEPLAPVVLHSLETHKPPESPMSEPEHIDSAMCLPSPDKASGDEENGWAFLENEVRLVLIGKTGVGKSTTGNNILGNKTFKSSASGASVTKKCQLGWASRFNRDIQIIDTPGLFDTGMSNEDISREIVKCIGMTSPGPHAFILVIRLDRFTAEEKATVEHFINVFGKDMTKYLIVLFTRMDDLKYEGTTLDEYVQNVPPDLQNLLEVCQHRRIGFDNRGTQEEKDKDVQDLLKMVDSMVKGNGGGHYTNEMYEEAERIIAEQEEEHLRKNREEMQREMERLRQEVEEELRRKDEEKQKDLDRMKGQLSELGIDEDDEEWVQVFSLPPINEYDHQMKSPVSQNKGAAGFSAENTNSVAPVMVNGESSPAENTSSVIPMMVNGDVIEKQKPSSGESKRDTIEHKSADGFSKASDTTPPPASDVMPRPSSDATPRPQTYGGSIYQTDSYSGTQRESNNRSFLSNEPQRYGSTGAVSEHELEVQRLKERAMRMNEEHQRERERMRADYLSKQAHAYEKYNRKHMESRQRTRQEMNDTSSNVFVRFFGVMKRVIQSITTPIGRGLQSLFQSVHGRSTGQTIF